MRTDPLALIRGATEFVTVKYGPAVTFAFLDVEVEAYRRSVLHMNLISAVDGSALNWCKQHVLRELMSEDLLFAKISEPEMTVNILTINSVILWDKWTEDTSSCSQSFGT